MGTFFVYILKTSICLTGFYLFYRLLLSKETFHRFNRVALLGILLLSLLIPFCEITVPKESEVQQTLVTIEQILTLADHVPQTEVQALPSSIPLWLPVLLCIYLLGILFFLGRNLYSLFHMLRLLHGGRQEKLEKGITLIIHDKNIAPFSWMKYVVISEKDLQENSKEILIHEMAHVHNRHSIDLLISDICIIFQWFNPASWLLKQELQNIHEYEADETVIRQGVNAKQYQLLLIKKAVGTRLYSMANSFNHSKLKKRITMMLKEKSSPWARMKYLYVLPVAAITLTAFARPEISNELNEISTIKVNDITSILDAKEVNNSLMAVDTAQKTVITESTFKSTLPEDSIQSKTQHFFLKMEKTKATSVPLKIGQITLQDSCISTIPEIPVLFIVNGKEVSVDSVKMIDPNKIETITILKDKYAITQYGEKGKEGVVSITYTSGSPDKKVTSYKLADGTTVYLESETSTTGSYAIIHSKDTSSLRTVKLKGEARFKIVEKDSIIEYQVTSDTLKYGIQKKKEK
ncbi:MULTISPECIES: M56 family metallopeptidase [Butyricimonas]|uniref:M56 family metallopeptidase n=1 Tax=Butyricimonas TaxID=574697 RepID=UPI0020836F35|nr:M56 family metallopeptidase [Butyricimonas paravirosa]BDF54021.1 TonB-dependent receptor [Odoribacteraceae bacterium]GKH92960.1 TonB-dependent receptor [Odoribacteraceae bacterium]GKI00218.1 TonB-dependent receptor [Odoribacteraceae bacterium]GKI04745.1 TonB-dependent receptor [Odoribacteraceae bacterium]